jgi:hypothetical protein
MVDETEPTPATSAAEPGPSGGTETGRAGIRVPTWLAVGVVALAVGGGGFAIGRATASDHHDGFAPIGVIRPGGRPGDLGGRGGPGGPDPVGPGYGEGGNGAGAPGGDGNGGSNPPTTPSTTAGTGT